MTEFTPISALIGGALLGFGALLLLVVNGRIAGISGILSGALQFNTPHTSWRWAFLGGLIASGLLAPFASLTLPTTLDASWGLTICGGFVVGFGAYLGGGCTSGHGICGIGRMSVRSIVATIVFMLVAAIVVFINRHVVGG
ncbi:YeeE/YedE family protein [Shewanella sp. OMA3-2]|uniref:YeeE/YedE family protein n=1 Tax=Shewanella sp. OMA3-2 TaxID=2908650 RepID=UPI001F34677B|nr:YeeE/YedE thiosulfate transporter family protein [Shewanella sp. OMA3-2]UJF22629.1 YeeE/YedE family protein [Shewanella sp. OMA3-2]